MAKFLTTERGVNVIIRLWVKGPRILSYRVLHYADRDLIVQGLTRYADTPAGRAALEAEVLAKVDAIIFGKDLTHE